MAKKKSYTAAPPVPPQHSERLALVLEVLAGKTTVSEAARELGMSRNHFQTLLHRGLAGLIEGMGPKSAGRPAKPAELLALQEEVEQLRRENAQLQDRVGTTDRLLEVASGLLHGRIRATGRARQKKTKGAAGEKKPEDPDAEPRRLLQAAIEMRSLGLTARLAARIAGVHETTLRRWQMRERCGEPLLQRACCKLRSPSAAAAACASELVRSLHGLIGADALRRSVAGLSRREAARLKQQTLTLMESERKDALTRITVMRPDVMRGLDGMHLQAADGSLQALFIADAAVPYRTEVQTAKRYDAHLVAKALRADIELHGAPLVYRMDRARAHDAPAVHDILEANEVLVLHGPPRCPRFYGQHERQNREHRAWAHELALLSFKDVQPCLEEMLEAVNKLWRRRTLNWRTAYEAWSARPRLVIDRRALREEVIERACRIRQHLQCRGKPADLAERLAIEQALETRGCLRKEIGGWC